MGLEGSAWAVVAQSAVLKLENERQQLNPQRTGRVVDGKKELAGLIAWRRWKREQWHRGSVW